MPKRKFEFTELPKGENGYEVKHRGRTLGTIMGILESAGRHSFYLGCDDRENPRIYRGKAKAAEALLQIDEIKQRCKGKPLEVVVCEAWANRPAASSQAA